MPLAYNREDNKCTHVHTIHYSRKNKYEQSLSNTIAVAGIVFRPRPHKPSGYLVSNQHI